MPVGEKGRGRQVTSSRGSGTDRLAGRHHSQLQFAAHPPQQLAVCDNVRRPKQDADCSLTAGHGPVECCVDCFHHCSRPGVGAVVGHIDGTLVGRHLSLARLTRQRHNADGCT